MKSIRNRKINVFLISMLIVFFCMIMTFAWGEVFKFSLNSKFIIGIIFWIINIIILFIGLIGQFYINVNFPFRIAIIFTTILYTIIQCLLISFGLFAIGKITYFLLNSILLFFYLVIIFLIYLKRIK